MSQHPLPPTIHEGPDPGSRPWHPPGALWLWGPRPRPAAPGDPPAAWLLPPELVGGWDDGGGGPPGASVRRRRGAGTYKGPRPLHLSLSAPWASGATGHQPGPWGEEKWGPAKGRDQTHSDLPWVLPGQRPLGGRRSGRSVCGRGLGGDLRGLALRSGQGLGTWRTGPRAGQSSCLSPGC